MRGIWDALSAVFWGPPMMLLFLGTGIFFTVKSGFFQLHLPMVCKETILRRDKSENGNGVSPMRTLSTALGACMGTGNIAGVGTALFLGGPGALFWMCVSAFFGMMTAFAETVLSVRYREWEEKGAYRGGAMYVLRDALGMKKTAMLYAALLTLSSFGVGNMTQVNAAASAIHSAFCVPPMVSGVVFSVAVLLTVFGGIRRISAVTERAVPALSAVFLLSSLAVLWMHRAAVPGAVGLIFREAFRLRPAVGGAAGFGLARAMRIGVTRGVFSNEAGLGSTAVIHAASGTDSPVRQGFWGILEVFLDTILMCSITGLVILTSGNALTDADGASLYTTALTGTLGRMGGILTAGTLALLGFASLTGWAYCGERGVAYLFGEGALPVYRVLYAVAAFFGSFLHPETVFAVADILNASMAVPNLYSLWMLSGTVLEDLRMYRQGELCQHFPYKKEE